MSLAKLLKIENMLLAYTPEKFYDRKQITVKLIMKLLQSMMKDKLYLY